MAKIERELLPRCGGRLTPEEATEGMNAAIQNAKRLIDDAEILLGNQRYATAMTLSILAIEEAGKISILRGLLAAPDDKISSYWRDYRSHKAKNTAWILPELVRRGARTLLGLREAANPDGDHTAILDILKQIGYYTDFVGNRHWSKPEEVVDRHLAEAIFEIAKILAKDRKISVEENHLWIKHVGLTSENGMSPDGLLGFFSEAEEAGLIDTDLETITRFIFGGIAVEE